MQDKPKKIEYVAEISGNHLGSISRAIDLIYAAAESGATAVKFQTYTADTMTLDLDSLRVSLNHKLWGGKKLYDLYKEAYTPWEWHEELFQLCESLNLLPFSSPFDATAVEFLETLNVGMYKIASLETSDHPLIKRVSETGKPLIVSTGATTWREIEELIEVIRSTGNENLTLLLCTSAYPAAPSDSHINRLKLMQDYFGVKVGLSDHTLGIGVSIAAIGLGATVIEKHLTLKRSDGGPDSAFSLEPNEFKSLVAEGNSAFASLGEPQWQITESEEESRRLRRSLYIVQDVKAGDVLNTKNIRSIRPGSGCSPKYFEQILGMRFKSDFKLGTPLDLQDIE